MAKQLKFWNGRGHGIYGRHGETWHMNVAAYSQKQAAEILGIACERPFIRVNEIANYYHPCWGNDMAGIEATEPCVYAVERWSGKPIKVYPKPTYELSIARQFLPKMPNLITEQEFKVLEAKDQRFYRPIANSTTNKPQEAKPGYQSKGWAKKRQP